MLQTDVDCAGFDGQGPDLGAELPGEVHEAGEGGSCHCVFGCLDLRRDVGEGVRWLLVDGRFAKDRGAKECRVL